MTPLPDLVLYARPGCHLCEEAREAIEAVLADRRTRGLATPDLVERNIEDDPELHRQLMERIPVVELADRRIELFVSVGKVRRLLNELAGDAPVGDVPVRDAPVGDVPISDSPVGATTPRAEAER